MSISSGGDNHEVVLISPYEGRLLFDGKPASNASINITVMWQGDKQETAEFQSDQQGRFVITEKKVTTRVNPLSQFVIKQEIYVAYKGQQFLIWRSSRTREEAYHEFGGKPTALICEITDELESKIGEGLLLQTNYQWQTTS